MKTAPWIIIVILLGLLLLQRECTPVPDCPPCDPCTLQHCDTTIGDTIVYQDTTYIPVPYFIDTGSTKYIYMPVDTSAIIADYLTKKYYSDTLVNDSNLFVAIYDVMQYNSIISRQPVIRFFPTIITKTNTVVKDPVLVRKLFAGIGVGRNPKEFSLTANLMYISKRDNAYSFSYDVLNKDMYVTMYWKIKLKKRGR